MIPKIAATVATALLIITPVQVALANCAPRDLGGEWQFYNTWWNVDDGFNWSRCTFVLDKSGNFLAASDCEDSDLIGMPLDPTIEGQLIVSQDCVVTGSAILDDEVSEPANIIHATMNGRKDMIVGVGADGNTGSFWTFSMIEK